jgi:hypothetical protein
MEFQVFFALIGFTVLFIVVGISRLLFPQWWGRDAGGDNKLVRGIGVVLTIGIAVVCAGGAAYLLAPPLYKSLLKANPLLFARVLMVTFAVLMLIATLWLLLSTAKGFLGNLRRRIGESQYLDQKLGWLLQVVFLVFPLAWVAVPGLFLYGLLSSWDDMTYWNGIVQEMTAVQDFSTQGSSGKILTTSTLQAVRSTCLYEQKSLAGKCPHPQSAGSYVLTYLTTDAVVEDKVISVLQRGNVVYVLSLDPDSVLETGWVQRSNYQQSEDWLAMGGSLLRSLFSLAALQSVATDLVIGGVISFVIVLITRGALEHYLLSMTFVLSLLSMGLRYSQSGMIPPPDILILAVIPMAIGSLIEEKIIHLLRHFGR